MFGLFRKPKDWVIIHANKGDWRVKYADSDNSYDEHCNFEIKYSKSRNKVEIFMSGYKPTGHTLYTPMMEVLSIYNIGLLAGKPFPEIQKDVKEYIKNYNKNKKEDDKM